MELQALLVLCGVGVAGLAMLLLMGLFSASGTSYEEAIAQQRRATTELLALAESKNKPKKKERKANKRVSAHDFFKQIVFFLFYYRCGICYDFVLGKSYCYILVDCTLKLIKE